MGFLDRLMGSRTPAGPEFGGPTHDARIHPTFDLPAVARMRVQLSSFVGGDPTSPAWFSNYRAPTPSRVAVDVMGLAYQRDLIERAQGLRWALPWPGVSLPVISFHASPVEPSFFGSTNRLGFVDPRRHGAWYG